MEVNAGSQEDIQKQVDSNEDIAKFHKKITFISSDGQQWKSVVRATPNDWTACRHVKTRGIPLAELAPLSELAQNEAVKNCISVGGEFELEGWIKINIKISLDCS